MLNVILLLIIEFFFHNKITGKMSLATFSLIFFLICNVVKISLVLFPFMRPLFQFVTRLILDSSATEQAKARAFIMKAAEEVLSLRRQTGASQVGLA